MVAVMEAGGVELTAQERSQLLAWSRESSRSGLRARIVLACAEPGVVYAQVAREVGVSAMTVTNVRARFAAEGLAGLIDRPRKGRPKPELVLTEVEREAPQV